MKAGGKALGGGRIETVRALRSIERVMGRPATVEECGRLLKAEQVAQFLALDLSTVRHMTARGELPVIRTGKRGVAYQLIDLLGWIEARRESALD
jgi:excisionase family DNA binding protein